MSRPIEWGESRASFPIQATCDTNSQIVDKGNGATGQRGGEKEKGDAFLVNVAVKEGKEGGEKEFLRNQSSRDRELIIDQIYGIIVNHAFLIIFFSFCIVVLFLI